MILYLLMHCMESINFGRIRLFSYVLTLALVHDFVRVKLVQVQFIIFKLFNVFIYTIFVKV